MAGAFQLNLAGANVTNGTRSWERATTVVRDGHLTVHVRGQEAEDLGALTAPIVAHGRRGPYIVTTDQGEFTVVRVGGCGCGGPK